MGVGMKVGAIAIVAVGAGWRLGEAESVIPNPKLERQFMLALKLK